MHFHAAALRVVDERQGGINTVAFEGHFVEDDVVDGLGVEFVKVDFVHKLGPEPDGVGVGSLLAGNEGYRKQEGDKYLFHIY